MPELARLHMLVVNMMFSTALIPSLSPSQSFRKVQLHIPAFCKRLALSEREEPSLCEGKHISRSLLLGPVTDITSYCSGV